MRWITAALVLAFLGGTLGVALDAMHVASGTTRYREVWAFGLAWWAVPLFSAAAVALGLGPAIFERALAREPEPPRVVPALAGMALFVVAYLVSCFVHGAPGAIALLTIAVAIFALVDRRPLAAMHALTAAAGGFAVEAALVHRGAFVHTDAAILGIPLWLPCLYLCASLAVSSFARMLLALRVARYAREAGA
jgi:hypothetical protein